MKVLAVTHGPNVGPGVFRDAIEEAGHELDEWSMLGGSAPPSVEGYGGMIVFGGAMHADQEEQHPWLREEDAFLRGLLERRVPTLGVCLGAQLLVKAIGGPVFRAPTPEKGWMHVELTDAADDDPVIGALPRRFLAFDWHEYTWRLPEHDGAVELARSERYPQAYRIGERAWGIQFHAEVNRPIVRSWLDDFESGYPDRDAVWREIDAHMDEWNELGRSLCTAFVAAASRM